MEASIGYYIMLLLAVMVGFMVIKRITSCMIKSVVLVVLMAVLAVLYYLYSK
jgi:EamA domain-containing membrane protein RarD